MKCMDDIHGCISVARGHDCKDAGGRAMSGTIAEESEATGMSGE